MKPTRSLKKPIWKFEVPTCSKSHACQNVSNICKIKASMLKCSNYHAKWKVDMPNMWQIPCTMTGSSSRRVQIQDKWYQERNPHKAKPNQNKQKLFFTLNLILGAVTITSSLNAWPVQVAEIECSAKRPGNRSHLPMASHVDLALGCACQIPSWGENSAIRSTHPIPSNLKIGYDWIWGVSINGGTPLIIHFGLGFSTTNHPAFGVPLATRHAPVATQWAPGRASTRAPRMWWKRRPLCHGMPCWSLMDEINH